MRNCPEEIVNVLLISGSQDKLSWRNFILAKTLLSNSIKNACQTTPHFWNQPFRLNTLWPSHAIWHLRSWSTLIQVMASCLIAPSHYQNQCWLISSVRSNGIYLRWLLLLKSLCPLKGKGYQYPVHAFCDHATGGKVPGLRTDTPVACGVKSYCER